jgi:hypothetical protein
VIFFEAEVWPWKNASQFVVICALALPAAAAGLDLLGAAELGAEEVAGALEDGDGDEVDAGVLLELLQAAAVRASASTSAGARVIRRAKSLNRMTRLLGPGRMDGRNAAF